MGSISRYSCLRVVLGVVTATLILSIGSLSLHALHKNDHRFTVYGFVRDQEGKARSGEEVVIDHIGGAKEKTRTNATGYYEQILHLHNENNGDEIEVRVGEEVKKTVVVIDPEDRITIRRTQVDFGAPAKGMGAMGILLGVGVIGIGAGTYFGLGYLRKRGRAKGSAKSPSKKRKR